MDDMLQANQRYSEQFAQGDLPAPPAKHLAIVTCMDARIHPEKILGLEIGDAHVIRNAGGRITGDALRSLIISTWLLNTREVAIIHHTQCGMQSHSNAEVRKIVRDQTGTDVSSMDFDVFTDLEESVREDLRRLASSPHLPRDIQARGFIYDVQTGRLSSVSS
jgi:carbonic anhydrase